MNLNSIFTTEEKKTFLIRNGYELVVFSQDVWNQWGNHDSQGKWEVIEHVCAIKDGESPNINNTFIKVFDKIIINKFKEFLLQL